MAEPTSACGAREALEQCLRDHDRERAVSTVLAAVDDGLAIEDLYTHVLEPFLALVGRTWQEGHTAVWEEHLIVGAVRTAIDALYPKVLERKRAVPPTPVTVAFFCPPEETHDIGLRMLVDRFDLRGFRTVYVGALTPVAQMIVCARSVAADAVCLSASTHYQRAVLLNVVQTLSRELPDTRIVAGGPAFVQKDAGWNEYVVGSVDALLEELAARAPAGGARGITAETAGEKGSHA